MTATYRLARQIAYFRPDDDRGKWHAAYEISHVPVCGAKAPLSHDAIRTAGGEWSTEVHPIVCRRCLRLSAQAGRSAEGIKR